MPNRSNRIRTPTEIHHQIIQDKSYKKYSYASYCGFVLLGLGVITLLPMIAITTFLNRSESGGENGDNELDVVFTYLGPVLIAFSIVAIIVGLVISKTASRRKASRYLLRRRELMNNGDESDSVARYDIELVSTDVIMGLPSYEEVVGVEHHSGEFSVDEMTTTVNEEVTESRDNITCLPDEPPPPYEESPSVLESGQDQ